MVAPAASATTSFTPKAVPNGQKRFERSPRTSEVFNSPPANDRASGSDGDSLPPKQEARPALVAAPEATSDSDERTAALGTLEEAGRRVDRPGSSEVGELSESM